MPNTNLFSTSDICFHLFLSPALHQHTNSHTHTLLQTHTFPKNTHKDTFTNSFWMNAFFCTHLHFHSDDDFSLYFTLGICLFFYICIFLSLFSQLVSFYLSLFLAFYLSMHEGSNWTLLLFASLFLYSIPMFDQHDPHFYFLQ